MIGLYVIYLPEKSVFIRKWHLIFFERTIKREDKIPQPKLEDIPSLPGDIFSIQLHYASWVLIKYKCYIRFKAFFLLLEGYFAAP
jgi:hypothetical protein